MTARMKLPCLTVGLILALLLSYAALGEPKTFTEAEWWKNTIIYQIYPRSFQDSNGDGVGDLKGITSRLDHFREINVGCIWISPIFKSPFADFGYDVADFKAIDELFGTMEDFDELLEEAHNRGIKVLLDFVPNHSSNEHDWFNKSASSGDYTNEYRDYYMWADPKPGCTDPDPRECIPNNWVSVFSGSMWEWYEPRQQFYLHQFLKEQPDLNCRNPIVRQELADCMSFWLDKGIDGFRLDAIYHMFEDPGLEDDPENPEYVNAPGETQAQYDSLLHTMTTRDPDLHDVLRDWRKNVFAPRSTNQYRFMVTEAYDPPEALLDYYGTPEEPEADFPFNFQLIQLSSEDLSGNRVYELVEPWMNVTPADEWPNWVIGNHDNFRIYDRIGANFVRSANMLNILLPGTATTYYGEEIGMQNINTTYENTQDPYAKNNPCCWKEYTRDPERSPMQWDTTEQAGFTTSDSPWLPVSDMYLNGVNVESQRADPESTLNHYKAITDLRLNTPAFQTNTMHFAVRDQSIFSFFRYPDPEDAATASVFFVVFNFGPGVDTRNYVQQVKDYDVTVEKNADIRISSGMDRDGSVDLTSLTLASGEALVLRVDALPPGSAAVHITSYLMLLLPCVVLAVISV